MAAPSFGIGLVLVSVVSLQSGAAFAKTLFAPAGVVGVVFMRNAFSAAVLWAVARPRLRSYSRRHWRYAAVLGLVTAEMNLTFYEAAARLPIGIAVAIGFLGPISVAAIRSRRPRQLGWPVLAYSGVVMLAPIGGVSAVDPAGVAIALAIAVGWGLYVVMTARTSDLFGQAAGLTLASTVTAMVMLPLLLTTDVHRLAHPRTLVLGFAMAMLATTVPCTCDYIVLRRMPQQIYGVLLSLEPAVAALLGLAVLGETLGAREWLAIALVVTASAGATASRSRTRDPKADCGPPPMAGSPPCADAGPYPPLPAPCSPEKGRVGRVYRLLTTHARVADKPANPPSHEPEAETSCSRARHRKLSQENAQVKATQQDLRDG